MPNIIGVGVSLRGIEHEDFHYPFNLASSVTSADVGKAVALDTTAANTVKVAGAGDVVVGKLTTFEDRTTEGIKVGAVAMKGGFRFSTGSNVVAIGDTLQGAAGGVTAKLATANPALNTVVEIGGTAPNLYAVAIFK